MRIVPRNRAKTAVTQRGCAIIPSRPKLGPRVPSTDGEGHTVTLTGPTQLGTVTFPVEVGKSYRIFSTVLACNATVYTPEPNTDEQFLGSEGTYSVAPSDKRYVGSSASEVQPYGFEATGFKWGPAGGTSVRYYMGTADEADAGFSITHGNFYIREIKG